MSSPINGTPIFRAFVASAPASENRRYREQYVSAEVRQRFTSFIWDRRGGKGTPRFATICKAENVGLAMIGSIRELTDRSSAHRRHLLTFTELDVPEV